MTEYANPIVNTAIKNGMSKEDALKMANQPEEFLKKMLKKLEEKK
ncbi:hypothetical protein [Lactococcus sp.]